MELFVTPPQGSTQRCLWEICDGGYKYPYDEVVSNRVFTSHLIFTILRSARCHDLNTSPEPHEMYLIWRKLPEHHWGKCVFCQDKLNTCDNALSLYGRGLIPF